METSFQDKLIGILKTDSRFIDQDGELVKAAIIDRAWKIDRDLVKLLLSDASIKQKFFDEIEGHWVFNVNTFIDYISDKDFLDNSYTRFRNKIGLNIDGKYLKERGEVCLVWPYKDCILEGGQTKEEEKRKEIFFNEILAQDEVDRLLDPKVLTNWKRYTTDGEQEVFEITRDESNEIKENLLIKGNNLLALHCLKHQFMGRIRLIYIDPPYGTGSDSFKYNDNFLRSTYLTFMKNRLVIARELLHKNGIIAVQSSFHQYAYLKVLMDEIFDDQYLCTLNIKVRHPERILTGDKDYNDIIEYIILYSKSQDYKFPKMEIEKEIDEYIYEIVEKEPTSKIALGKHEVEIFEPTNYIVNKKDPDRNLFKKISIRGSIREKNSSGRYYVRYLENLVKEYPPNTIFKVPEIGDDVFQYRYFYLPAKNKKNGGYYQGMPISSNITRKQYSNYYDFSKEYNNVAYEGGVSLRLGKKPEALLKFLIELFTEKGDVVLDYHLGSGTTCAVAHKIGRQYIGIEQLDYSTNDSVIRLQGVLKGEQSGISKELEWKGGGEFIHCELLKYNESYFDKVQSANTSDEIIDIWKDISTNSFLNWYVNPEAPEDALNDFIEIGRSDNGLEKQKKLLCELLNKNQLYVNLSEIEDAKFSVTEHDKELNKQFYGDAYNA